MIDGPVDIGRLRHAHRDLLAQLTNDIWAAQEETARFIKNQVANHIGWKNSRGGLAKKTETQVIRTRGGNKLIIRNRAKYALAQEFGSGTHAGRGKYRIQGKRGGALRFVVNGRVFVRRSVMHPGVPATHFLYRAVMSSESHDFQFLRSRMASTAVRFNNQRV